MPVRPLIEIFPESIGIKPNIHFSRRDFPEAAGPTITLDVPGARLNETSSIMRLSSKLLITFSSDIAIGLIFS